MRRRAADHRLDRPNGGCLPPRPGTVHPDGQAGSVVAALRVVRRFGGRRRRPRSRAGVSADRGPLRRGRLRGRRRFAVDLAAAGLRAARALVAGAGPASARRVRAAAASTGRGRRRTSGRGRPGASEPPPCRRPRSGVPSPASEAGRSGAPVPRRTRRGARAGGLRVARALIGGAASAVRRAGLGQRSPAPARTEGSASAPPARAASPRAPGGTSLHGSLELRGGAGVRSAAAVPAVVATRLGRAGPAADVRIAVDPATSATTVSLALHGGLVRRAAAARAAAPATAPVSAARCSAIRYSGISGSSNSSSSGSGASDAAAGATGVPSCESQTDPKGVLRGARRAGWSLVLVLMDRPDRSLARPAPGGGGLGGLGQVLLGPRPPDLPGPPGPLGTATSAAATATAATSTATRLAALARLLAGFLGFRRPQPARRPFLRGRPG